MRRFAPLAAAAALVLAGCGGGGSDNASQPAASLSVVTVTAETPLAATPSPASTATQASPRTSPSPAAPTTSAAATAGTVPNVVGKDHQFAQDTMQAAGFHNLTEEDATGQGRSLIFDRGWVVVSQQPKGGTKAASDTTIILRSRKIGE